MDLKYDKAEMKGPVWTVSIIRCLSAFDKESTVGEYPEAIPQLAICRRTDAGLQHCTSRVIPS